MARTAKPMISGRLDTWSGRPAIVFVLETDDGVGWLHDRLRELAHGEVGTVVDIHRARNIEVEGFTALRLAVSDVPPEVALVAGPEGEFAWTCATEGWASIADLLEPFLAGRSGHQYLHHAFGSTGEADVVISRGEATTSVEAEPHPDGPPVVPIEQPKEDVMAKSTTDAPAEVAEPPATDGAPEIQGSAPRILGVTVPCTDLDRSRAFYSAVLGVAPDDTVPGRAFFAAGGARIVLSESSGTAPAEIFFTAEPLEAAHDQVAASDAAPSPIAVSWSGERSFGCTDPDGNRLWFVDARTIRLPAA